MIKTIFFDIGGVLIDIHPERTAEYIGLKSQIPREIVESSFPIEEHHKYERGQIRDQDFFTAVKRKLPAINTLQETDFWTGWGMMVGHKTAAVYVLEEMTKSYSVWIVSNTNPYHIMNETSRFSFFKQVHGSVLSFEVNSRKPEPKIYFKALELAGANPAESLFIDDMIENIEQAKALGFHSIHFTSVDDTINQMQALGISFA